MVMVTDRDRERARDSLTRRKMAHDGLTVELVAEVMAAEREAFGKQLAGAGYKQRPADGVHDLKCWPSYFEDIFSGKLTFCMRRNDRGYQVGDVLWLREFDPTATTAEPRGAYTGREVRRHVRYVMAGGQHGIDEGYVVLGLDPEANVVEGVASTPSADEQLERIAKAANDANETVFRAAGGHFNAADGVCAVLTALVRSVGMAKAQATASRGGPDAEALREQAKEISVRLLGGKFPPAQAERRAALTVERNVAMVMAALAEFTGGRRSSDMAMARALYIEFTGCDPYHMRGLSSDAKQKWLDMAVRVRRLLESPPPPASSPTTEDLG